MIRPAFIAFLVLATLTSARGQWRLQDAHATADLRGIDSVGNDVAWASGTGGTVLRTLNGGKDWQSCTVPPDGQMLDFRGIQAFDENTAIVMSSGKGDLSRLYKTTDGCQTWKLLFTDPSAKGFWSAVKFIQGTGRESGRIGYLAGNPVGGSFAEFITYNYGQSWDPIGPGVGSLGPAKVGEALFAVSNSAFQLLRNSPVIVTGGTTSRLREAALHVKDDPRIYYEFVGGNIPIPHSSSAGAFSFDSKLGSDSVAEADTKKFIEKPTHQGDILVAVGGNDEEADDPRGTAAFSSDGGMKWTAAITMPHGYRSAVAYDSAKNYWITVGPNGTDISTDDGRNWRPLTPSVQDAADADKDWNALSLPFAVGPKGRIGKLNAITAAP